MPVPLYRVRPDDLVEVAPTSFSAERVRERDDLQRLLRKRVEVLGEDLLVVAEEYALFQDSRRRIDLLAVDRRAQLVVIELKRTDDGGHMELQALRYAAMVSTMSYDDLVAAYAHYNEVDETDARVRLDDWVEEADAPGQLTNTVRLVLVSGDFSIEVTDTVLWLSEQYGMDISCWRLRPYRLGTELLLDLTQIIPLPEAADFQVQQRRKGVTAAAARVSEHGRDFTKYDVSIAGRRHGPLSKQGAVKTTVREAVGGSTSTSATSRARGSCRASAVDEWKPCSVRWPRQRRPAASRSSGHEATLARRRTRLSQRCLDGARSGSTRSALGRQGRLESFGSASIRRPRRSGQNGRLWTAAAAWRGLSAADAHRGKKARRLA